MIDWEGIFKKVENVNTDRKYHHLLHTKSENRESQTNVHPLVQNHLTTLSNSPRRKLEETRVFWFTSRYLRACVDIASWVVQGSTTTPWCHHNLDPCGRSWRECRMKVDDEAGTGKESRRFGKGQSSLQTRHACLWVESRLIYNRSAHLDQWCAVLVCSWHSRARSQGFPLCGQRD